MASIFARALQPLRPVLAASAAPPRGPVMKTVAAARALPVRPAGGVFCSAGPAAPLSAAPLSALFFSSTARRAEADDESWNRDPVPKRDPPDSGQLKERRKIARKRMQLEKKRAKMEKILETKGIDGLLNPKREAKVLEKERQRLIIAMERQMAILPESEEGQAKIKEHLEKFAEERRRAAERRAKNKMTSEFNRLEWDKIVDNRRMAKREAKEEKLAMKRERKRVRKSLMELEELESLKEEDTPTGSDWGDGWGDGGGDGKLIMPEDLDKSWRESQDELRKRADKIETYGRADKKNRDQHENSSF